MRAIFTWPCRWGWHGATTRGAGPLGRLGPQRQGRGPGGARPARAAGPRPRRPRRRPAGGRAQQLAALTLASPKPGQEQERRRELDGSPRRNRSCPEKSASTSAGPRAMTVDRARGGPPRPARRRRPGRDRSIRCLQLPGQGDREVMGAAALCRVGHPARGPGRGPADRLGAADLIEADRLGPPRHPARPRGPARARRAGRRDRAAPVPGGAGRPGAPAAAAHIGDAKRWVLSPDAALWLVPWAALPLAKDGSAIENTRSTTSSAAGTWSRPPRRPGPVQAPVMADPDYDLGPAAVPQPARRCWPRGAPVELASRAVRCSGSGTSSAGRHRDEAGAMDPGSWPSRSSIRLRGPVGVGGGV